MTHEHPTLVRELETTLTAFFQTRTQAVRDPWAQIMDGFLVDVHVKAWTGKTRLSAEDFGFPERTVKKLDASIEWGKLSLIDVTTGRKLSALETRARRIARKWSRRTHWGQYIPVSAMGAFKEAFAEIVAVWNAVIADWMMHYDVIRESAEQRVRAHIASAAEIASQFGHSLEEEAAFIRLMASYPEREVIPQKFALSYELAFIPSPTMLAEQAAQAEAIHREALRDQERRQAELNKERDLAELERLQRQTALDKERLKHEERLRIIREENEKFQRGLAKEKKKLLDMLYRGYALDIRQRLHESLMYLQEGIQKGTISASAGRSLATVLDEIEHLALDSDEEIKAMQQRCQALLAQGELRPHLVKDAVADIGLLLQTEITALGGRPRIPKRHGTPLKVELFADIDGDEPLTPRIEAAKRRMRITTETLAETLISADDTPRSVRRRQRIHGGHTYDDR